MPETIYKSTLLYLIIGLVLWKAYPLLDGFAKDMLFFILFAITVTSSVLLAGVLTVFIFLIAPPFIALNFGKERLVFAWGGRMVNLNISYFCILLF